MSSIRRPPWLLPPAFKRAFTGGLATVLAATFGCTVERTIGEDDETGLSCRSCEADVRSIDLAELTSALEARVAAGPAGGTSVPTSLDGLNSIRGLVELPSGDLLAVGVLDERPGGEPWGFIARVTPSGGLVYEGISDVALQSVATGPQGEVAVGWDGSSGVVLRGNDRDAWRRASEQSFHGARFHDVVWDGHGGYFIAGESIDDGRSHALALHYDGADMGRAVDLTPAGGSVDALLGVDVFPDGTAIFVGRREGTGGEVMPWAAVAQVDDAVIWSEDVRGDRDPPGELRDVAVVPGGHGVGFGVTQAGLPTQMSLVAEANITAGWVTAGDGDTGAGFTAAATGANRHAFGFEMIARDGVDWEFDVRVTERWLVDTNDGVTEERTYLLDVDNVFIEAAAGLADGRLLFGGYETRLDGSTRPWLGLFDPSEAAAI